MPQSNQPQGRTPPHLVSVAGLRKSGKTTVVEALVSGLRSRGHEVGTIKTMRDHDISLDPAGRDSRRHAEAGASVVVAIHAGGTARFEAGSPPRSLEEVAPLFPDRLRILVCEGTIESSLPSCVVVCLRSPGDLEETLWVRGVRRESVTAVSGAGAASWRDAKIPSFDVSDQAQKSALVDLLLEKLGMPKHVAPVHDSTDRNDS